MPMCCVFKCGTRGGHEFPKNKDLRKQWIAAVKRESTYHVAAGSRVCSAHFNDEDYCSISGETGLKLKRRILKKDAVPSKFPWKKNLTIDIIRSSRLTKRNARKLNEGGGHNYNELHFCDHLSSPTEERSASSSPALDHGEESFVCSDLNVGLQIEESSDCSSSLEADPESVQSDSQLDTSVSSKGKKCSVSVATQTKASLFSVFNFKDNPSAIHYYTGLENFEKFWFVFSSLGPAVHELIYRWNAVVNLSVEDQLFMTLIKLRLAMSDLGLAIQFDVGQKTCENIIVTWINFLALEWSELNIWPSRDLVDYYMPEGFKQQYPSTRVILDGTEIPISKPTKPKAQQASFSQYKNRNTVQVLLGASPGGMVTHCSPAYGGSISDRAIVERSDLISKCDRKDSIMADRGFTVQDLFAPKDIAVNIPNFLKGRSQLPGLTVLRDRKLASKRVHIERIIGLAKTYRILKQEMNPYYVQLASEIVFICAMLCNFRECIVSKTA